MLAGVIGGAGRFLGGLVGGLAGGTVSGVLFPWMFLEMRRIVESIERIVNRLGLERAERHGQGAVERGAEHHGHSSAR